MILLVRYIHHLSISENLKFIVSRVLANALNASASIFEALVDVDGKFVKIADKEYDAISTEVKRWFKRLTVRFSVETPPF